MESEHDLDLTNLEKLPSTVARIMLGGRLRALREKAGISSEDAARCAGIARATMWRLERGDVKCRYKPGDIRILTEKYRAGDEARLLTALAVATRNRMWSSTILPGEVERYIGLEIYASVIRWYSPHLIPDPLQITDYALAATRARPGRVGTELRDIVQAHPFRQARVMDNGTTPEATFAFVMDEAVLHRPVGSPKQMARQLRDVLALTERPHVSVRVFPLDYRIPAGLYTGPFTILDFPSIPLLGALPTAVYRDPATSVEGKEAAILQSVFDYLHGQALSDQASRDLIDRAAKRFENG